MGCTGENIFFNECNACYDDRGTASCKFSTTYDPGYGRGVPLSALNFSG